MPQWFKSLNYIGTAMWLRPLNHLNTFENVILYEDQTVCIILWIRIFCSVFSTNNSRQSKGWNFFAQSMWWMNGVDGIWRVYSSANVIVIAKWGLDRKGGGRDVGKLRGKTGLQISSKYMVVCVWISWKHLKNMRNWEDTAETKWNSAPSQSNSESFSQKK